MKKLLIISSIFVLFSCGGSETTETEIKENSEDTSQVEELTVVVDSSKKDSTVVIDSTK